MSEEAPQTQKVRAIDVLPYRWGIWCTVGDNPKPFVNAIEMCSWSEDGQHIWFMLGTHNFHKALPDEEVELVAIEPPSYALKDMDSDRAKFLASRPTPTKKCETCGGSGKVPAIKSEGGA